MNDWFSWNGKKCTEYGIHVLEQPPITIPAERATFTDVPGRPGSLTTLEGDDVYDDLILTAQCMISDPSNIRAIASYLKGCGKVAFANRPGGFYFARIVNQIPFEKILRGNPHRSFAVNFRCKPFWYQENVPEITVTASGTFVNNPGSVYSEPVITVYGSGEITLMVGMTIVELDGITDSITLDTPLMEAYKDTTSMNSCMSGDFPTLLPGQNAISWTGNVTKVEVQPNWRFLYAVPSIRRFSVERCNEDGSSAQVDGTKARFSFQGSVSPLNNKNSFSCVVYYKLKNAEAWTQAYTVNAASYTLAVSNQLLSQTYDALSSYDVKIRLADYFQKVEQAVSIGTKGVILDFLADGTGIGIGKVAETPGAIECGWPLKLSDPLSIAYGGTGAASAENALAALGGVKKAGDAMTGNLRISESLYPSLFLLPTYNGTSSRTVLEGSYEGAASLAAWEDAAGDNRRMLEIRTKALQASLDWALVLRACEAGVWNNYRVFHSGMPSGVPVANGGTGAANAADARKNLGANNAGNLTTGTLPAARLPFKFAYGSTTINGSSAAYVDYSAAGFTSVPVVLITYATTSGNWSGDNGAIKVYNKTTTSCQVIVGGNFNTSRAVDWFAFGT